LGCGVAQVIEDLLSKCEALNSNHHISKRLNYKINNIEKKESEVGGL
jgi:hypothetical protein